MTTLNVNSVLVQSSEPALKVEGKTTSGRFIEPFKLGFPRASGLAHKKPTAENKFAAGVQKIAYMGAAVLVGVAELFKNILEGLLNVAIRPINLLHGVITKKDGEKILIEQKPQPVIIPAEPAKEEEVSEEASQRVAPQVDQPSVEQKPSEIVLEQDQIQSQIEQQEAEHIEETKVEDVSVLPSTEEVSDEEAEIPAPAPRPFYRKAIDTAKYYMSPSTLKSAAVAGPSYFRAKGSAVLSGVVEKGSAGVAKAAPYVTSAKEKVVSSKLGQLVGANPRKSAAVAMGLTLAADAGLAYAMGHNSLLNSAASSTATLVSSAADTTTAFVGSAVDSMSSAANKTKTFVSDLFAGSDSTGVQPAIYPKGRTRTDESLHEDWYNPAAGANSIFTKPNNQPISPLNDETFKELNGETYKDWTKRTVVPYLESCIPTPYQVGGLVVVCSTAYAAAVQAVQVVGLLRNGL